MSEWNDERDWYNDRIVTAILSYEMVDKQGQLIKLDGLTPHMPFFIEHGVIHYGNTGEGHTPIVIGAPLAWKIDGNQLLIKWGVHKGISFYDDIWKEIQDYGKEGAMSIGGIALSDPRQKCMGHICHEEVAKMHVWEASWVGDHPANIGAKVKEVAIAKSNLSDVIMKPFGPWSNFEDCMKEMRDEYGEERGKKVCGKLKAEMEKGGPSKVYRFLLKEVARAMEEDMTDKVEKQEELPPEEEELPEEGGVTLEDVMAAVQAIDARVTALEEGGEEPLAEEEEISEASANEGKVKKETVEYKTLEETIQKAVEQGLETRFGELAEGGSTVRPELIEKAEKPQRDITEEDLVNMSWEDVVRGGETS